MLESFRIDGLDCYRNSELSVVKNINCTNFYDIFSQSWRFVKKIKNGLPWEKYLVQNNDIEIDIYKKTGIRFIYKPIDDAMTGIQFIDNELSMGKMVIVHINGYFCPTKWEYHNKEVDPAQIEYFRHCIILTKKEGAKYIFSDTAPLVCRSSIDINDLKKGLYGLSYYTVENKVDKRPLEIDKNNLKLSINKLIKVEKESLLEFYYDIESENIWCSIKKQQFAWSDPFYRMLVEIYGGRKQFYDFLEYYIQNSEIMEKMKEIITSWNLCRILAMKQVVDGRVKENEFLDKLNKAINLEIEFLRSNEKPEQRTVKEDCWKLSLDKYYNKTSVEPLKIYHTRVVECCGQSVVNINKAFDFIYIEGYGLKRDVDTLTIAYENMEENINIYFSDWKGSADFGENVTKKIQYHSKEYNGMELAQVYERKYSISNDKKVISITLPQNENIHILNISFGNYVE
ncbi:MAG: hypothetical protein J1F02_04130 [Lachnospiraceae bacterium]|nr:hypothetical protein [Lachnospiraceae bacterium]